MGREDSKTVRMYRIVFDYRPCSKVGEGWGRVGGGARPAATFGGLALPSLAFDREMLAQ